MWSQEKLGCIKPIVSYNQMYEIIGNQMEGYYKEGNWDVWFGKWDDWKDKFRKISGEAPSKKAIVL